MILVGVVVACVTHHLRRKIRLPGVPQTLAYLLTSLIAGFLSSLLVVAVASMNLGYVTPFWDSMLAIVTWWCTLIALAVGLYFRENVPPEGHCEHCGYDLTGNVSGVCPECGREIAGE